MVSRCAQSDGQEGGGRYISRDHVGYGHSGLLPGRASRRLWRRPHDLLSNQGRLRMWPPHINRPSAGQLITVERRSEEHTSELQSLMRISYAVFCLKKKKHKNTNKHK